MAKRTKTRTPGLYKLPDGRFQVMVTATKGGRRVTRKQVLPFGVQLVDAKKAVGDLRKKLQDESMDEPITERAEMLDGLTASSSLTDYAVRWLEAKAERLKPSTIERYRQSLADHILPTFLGATPIGAIRRMDIERWVAGVEQGGAALATQRGWFRVLRQVLSDAQADRVIGQNPASKDGLVPKTRALDQRPRLELQTLEPEQLGALIEHIHENQPQRFAEVCVFAYTGLRSGEVYALRWGDLQGDRLAIERAHWRGHEGTTKSNEPREVVVPRPVITAIQEHRRYLLGLCRRNWKIRERQHPLSEESLMFPSNIGTHRTHNSLNDLLKSTAARLNLGQKVTTRVFRRTFNTLAIRAGIDRIVLRATMGHTREEMTERYAGISPEAKREANEKLGQLLTFPVVLAETGRSLNEGRKRQRPR